MYNVRSNLTHTTIAVFYVIFTRREWGVGRMEGRPILDLKNGSIPTIFEVTVLRTTKQVGV